MSWAVAILGLAFLILIHEAGHFVVARALGMRPRKFYVGFPPALAKTTRNGIEYGLGAIPLGGYVKIPGMHRPAPRDVDAHFSPALREAPELTTSVERLKRKLDRGEFDAERELHALEAVIAEVDLSPAARRSAERGLRDLADAFGPDAYWRARTWKRIAVIFAGPGTNLAFAIGLLTLVFVIGVRMATLTVGEVTEGSPGQAAGLRSGDRIVAIGGEPTTSFDEFFRRVQESEGRTLVLRVVNDGRERELVVTPARHESGIWIVGFRPAVRWVRYGPLEAAQLATERTWEVTVAIGGAFGRLATGKGRDEIASPVGITRVSSAAVEADFRIYLQLLAFISLSLALLNLLPLLPLDGGHIAFSLVEAVRRRAVGRDVYERVSIVGIALVLTLFFIGLSNDLSGRGPG